MTEFIEGKPAKHSFLAKKEHQKISTLIFDFLANIGIRPEDLQYRIDQKGRLWIVDTGAFQFSILESKLSPEQVQADLDKIFQINKPYMEEQLKSVFKNSFFKRWF